MINNKTFFCILFLLFSFGNLSFAQPPKVPEYMVFAGDTVKFDNLERYSKMDRELLTFSYMHSTSTLMLKRADLYFPVVEKILKKHGLPYDLKYIMVMESNLDPSAVSKAGAAGLWQFMAPSARQYGLEVNPNVDERYHVEKATEAACRYLTDLYRRYGDWMSVAASYNAGPGAISRQLEVQKGNNSLDLWLNAETSRYMYRVIAAKMLFLDPESFGFSVNDSNVYHYSRPREVVTVTEPITDLVSFASRHGVSYSELKAANLWLRESSLKNATHKAYQIIIPATAGRPDGYDWHCNSFSSVSGLGISFYTDSPEIVIPNAYADIELYVTDQHGVTSKLDYPYSDLKYETRHGMGNQYRLFIPGMERDELLKIGVSKGSIFKWGAKTLERPVAVIGSARFATLVESLSDSPVVIADSEEDALALGAAAVVKESDFRNGLDAKALNLALGREVNDTFYPVRQRREPDSYEWEDRHEKVMFRNKTNQPQVVLIGDSITHFWSGEPVGHRQSGNGSWDSLFRGMSVTNMGFGWDRIENVYWRIFHGELDSCSPEHIFLFIGTNNLEKNTNEEIADGIRGLAELLSKKQSGAKIHVVGIYPRYEGEARVRGLNSLIDRTLVRAANVEFIDYGYRFLKEDGKIESSLFLDGLHPNEKGYSIIAEELAKVLR